MELAIKYKKAKETTTFDFKATNKLVIPTKEGYTLLPYGEVKYLKADSNYTEIHTISKGMIVVSKTMKFVESRLNHFFVRVHASYIANFQFVAGYSHAFGLTLDSGEIIPVSKSMKKQVSNLFN